MSAQRPERRERAKVKGRPWAALSSLIYHQSKGGAVRERAATGRHRDGKGAGRCSAFDTEIHAPGGAPAWSRVGDHDREGAKGCLIAG
jgi:hypothetical protein